MRKSVFHTSLPSLSLLALAGHTPDSFRLHYLDENFQALPHRVDCDIAAITSITCQAPRAYALASRFRRQGAHVVLGGIHPTILPGEAARHADTVITGEAEGLWEQFLEDWLDGKPKRFYRPGEGKACTDTMPGYGLLQPSRHGTVPVQLGKGCPWGCDYCSVPAVHGRRYRRRRFSLVLEELRFVKRRWRGLPLSVFFVDDRLLFRGEYMGRLLEELGSLGVQWMAQADMASLSGEKLVRRLSRAGCRRLLVAVDPAEGREGRDPSGLGAWEGSLRCCAEALRRVRRHGMDLSLMFMLGREGDGPQLFRHLEDFLVSEGVSDMLAAIQTPLPGTALYRRLRRQGRLLPERSWAAFNLFNVVYRPEGVSSRQLAAAQTRLLKAVYGKNRRAV
jgi:radical SAM superfamily enzyme YgiQ (UPF0313 family)